jgi:hypothetical protein
VTKKNDNKEKVLTVVNTVNREDKEAKTDRPDNKMKAMANIIRDTDMAKLKDNKVRINKANKVNDLHHLKMKTKAVRVTKEVTDIHHVMKKNDNKDKDHTVENRVKEIREDKVNKEVKTDTHENKMRIKAMADSMVINTVVNNSEVEKDMNRVKCNNQERIHVMKMNANKGKDHTVANRVKEIREDKVNKEVKTDTHENKMRVKAMADIIRDKNMGKMVKDKLAKVRMANNAHLADILLNTVKTKANKTTNDRLMDKTDKTDKADKDHHAEDLLPHVITNDLTATKMVKTKWTLKLNPLIVA